MRRSEKKMRGSALAYGLVIMTVVMILLVSILNYIVSQLKFSSNRIEREKAFQIAEAGIYHYRWYLAHATNGMTSDQIDAFWLDSSTWGISGDLVTEYSDPETGEAIGKYTIHLDPPQTYTTMIYVSSTGETYRSPEIKRTVRVRFRRASWSEYTYLSNSSLQFGSDAEIWGTIHSNEGIRFDGLAHNTISSLQATYDDPTHGDNKTDFGVHTHKVPADPSPAPSYPWPDGTVADRPDVFEGGRAFPKPEISFSGVTTNLNYMKTKAQAGQGVYFDDTGLGRRVKLKTDGTFDVCTVAVANSNTHAISKYLETDGSGLCNKCLGACLANYAIPQNGVIFVENNIWFEGSISNKRVTVAAANLTGVGDKRDIYIGINENNIRHAAYDCDNILGLVAQKDILILSDCANNFVIDAALLAQEGVLGISQNFTSKNSITFNGAISSFLPPDFEHGLSGLAVRNFYFDNNLLYCPPPYFPTGTEYMMDLWEEV